MRKTALPSPLAFLVDFFFIRPAQVFLLGDVERSPPFSFVVLPLIFRKLLSLFLLWFLRLWSILMTPPPFHGVKPQRF